MLQIACKHTACYKRDRCWVNLRSMVSYYLEEAGFLFLLFFKKNPLHFIFIDKWEVTAQSSSLIFTAGWLLNWGSRFAGKLEATLENGQGHHALCILSHTLWKTGKPRSCEKQIYIAHGFVYAINAVNISEQAFDSHPSVHEGSNQSYLHVCSCVCLKYFFTLSP